ncbi:hypothetical protein HDU83_009208 [Entophlyctis luteolus]|nr:hypothetical protein HDU83_009208 [Entophlyctis luteolus]
MPESDVDWNSELDADDEGVVDLGKDEDEEMDADADTDRGTDVDRAQVEDGTKTPSAQTARASDPSGSEMQRYSDSEEHAAPMLTGDADGDTATVAASDIQRQLGNT